MRNPHLMNKLEAHILWLNRRSFLKADDIFGTSLPEAVRRKTPNLSHHRSTYIKSRHAVVLVHKVTKLHLNLNMNVHHQYVLCNEDAGQIAIHS